uniref:Pentraxin (PTX) domain-containing protein n=1 Tax=Malurus cyaneus samueli TaxID=2593467 RepID=A0A8C5UBK3_9PASS
MLSLTHCPARRGAGPLLLLLLLGPALGQGLGQTRFICTSVPLDGDVCAASALGTGSAEELKGTVLQLRETVLQQKETIMNQKETIRELTAKLGRCESQSVLEPSGEGKGGRASPRIPWPGTGSRCPAVTSRSSARPLQQFSRMNSSSQTNNLKDILQNKIDDLEKQVLSRVNSLEEGKLNPRNESEERGKIESTLTSLHQRISDLEKGQKDNRPRQVPAHLPPTNYMYAKVKKSLPEMYAFSICMWIKSSANELVLIEWGNNPMEILINDKVAKLPFAINDGKWHHICVTWTTRDGVWEAYQDGTQTGNGENLAPYHPIKPQGVLVLGQEQDTLGGGFDATQAFVGELAHFNVWDRKLSPGEVYGLATCSSKALAGNVIAWAETNIDIYGGATKWTFEACRQLN